MPLHKRPGAQHLRTNALTRDTRRRQTARSRTIYQARGWLLSRGELAFYRTLRQAAGDDVVVFAKVRLADIIRCDRAPADWGPLAAISQKHLDFVLCDPSSTRIRCVIELDDRSHTRPLRRQRDRFLNRVLAEARVPFLRFRAAAHYSTSAIVAELEAAATQPCRTRTGTDTRP